MGYGKNAKTFRDNGMLETGIEISKTPFGNDLTIYHGSITEMPFDNKLYDGIFFTD
ncbi:class I SAM-dependent methyltransferase [Xanthovirga aplysinae]|uniref:class I SAM-dependent methyltransferase n=1 Tax=Xanthovirga aplysinae TaxID=2529853 RepID=UPI001FE60F6F|nr:class I SAM-dependent methyltransferase [Xanthovirga aplysinae]